jgi:hypothetical protein
MNEDVPNILVALPMRFLARRVRVKVKSRDLLPSVHSVNQFEQLAEASACGGQQSCFRGRSRHRLFSFYPKNSATKTPTKKFAVSKPPNLLRVFCRLPEQGLIRCPG